jgi:16S rRNA (uracil1498-N3)-methyltransferase
MSKHIFAFYKENLSSLLSTSKVGSFFSFKDSELWNRLTKIIRIKAHLFILFDEKINVTLQAKDFHEKRTVGGDIKKIEENKRIKPEINFYLPVLKKEAFEYAIYVAAQMGVTKIFPITTELVSIAPAGGYAAKNIRLKKIMISACEQSKNFVFPEIYDPQNFEKIFENLEKNSQKICFDIDGEPVKKLFEKVFENKIEKYKVIVGPEGGFSEKEKISLQKAGFLTYKLTPTILRSREAVTVGLGILRSAQSSSPLGIKATRSGLAA